MNPLVKALPGQRIKWLVTPEELERIPPHMRGVGYIRVSKVGDRGDDLISPEIQEYSILEFERKEGIRVVCFVYDIDRSGRDFTKRQVAWITQGIREGQWKYAVLWKWSRWGRNMRESQVYLAHVESEGGEVRAATEDFDPKTTMGRFTRDQMLLIAQLQSDMASDGWKEAHAKRRRDGLPHSGTPRFGYTYDRKTGYIPDPETKDVLKAAYEAYSSGASHRGLAMEWNAAGLRTRTGKMWTQPTISRMMDTGFAAGYIRERSVQPEKAESKAIWRFDVWRKGAHEAIIDEQTWQDYKKRRNDQALMAPRLRTASHALSGLMWCGWEGCDGRMTSAWSGTRVKHFWACYKARNLKAHAPNSISGKRAMQLVLDWLTEKATGGGNVTEEAQRIEAGRKAASDAETFAAEVDRLTKKRRRLLDAYMDEQVDEQDYQEVKADLDVQIKAASDAHAAAKAREAASGTSIVRQFGLLVQEWDRFEPNDHREALSAVLAKITVMPGPYAPGKLKIVPAWEEAE
ncbi:recombinase family protein [Micromonospora sp. NPDC049751]|uniref:recombinase family protein n=1 Tax=Micromonospora sp. NPDC049751 TaxID=3154837 RepID=UPI003404E6F9